MTLAPGDVLLVEDADVHVEFTRLAFESEGIGDALTVARDGEEAVALIDERADRPPRLILLDLKLPRRSGLDVLAWRREQPELRRIPVVILTSSKQSRDLERAYDLGANSYLVKPVAFDDLLRMIDALKLYWIVFNEPPSGSGRA